MLSLWKNHCTNVIKKKGIKVFSINDFDERSKKS